MGLKGKSLRPLWAAISAGILLALAALAQAQTLSVPADSPRWDLQGQAKAAEYQGRKCLLLDGGAAVLKDFEMRDGVIDVDVATPAKRGFFGIQFRHRRRRRQRRMGLSPPAQVRASRRHAVHAGSQHRRATGKSTMGRASPARSISRKRSGSTCAWRWRARRQSSMSRTWTSPRW